MSLRSGLAVVSAIVLLTAVGIFALETNQTDPGVRFSGSVGIHDHPALIEAANELKDRGASMGEFVETLFPEVWHHIPDDQREFLYDVQMGWSAPRSKAFSFSF